MRGIKLMATVDSEIFSIVLMITEKNNTSNLQWQNGFKIIWRTHKLLYNVKANE